MYNNVANVPKHPTFALISPSAATRLCSPSSTQATLAPQWAAVSTSRSLSSVPPQ